MLLLLALLTAAPVLAQETPARGDTLEVLPPDHPLRPQPPPGVGPGPLAFLGRILFAPLRMGDVALKGTTVVIEEESGGFAAGLSDRPEAPGDVSHLGFRFGSIGTRSGFVGAGVTYDLFPGESGPALGFSAAVTNRLYQEYSAFAGWNDPDVAPWLRVTGYYDIDHMNEFWGVGPDTDKDDESGFSWERWGAVAAVGIPRGGIFNGEIHAAYERSFFYETYDDGQVNTVDEFVGLSGVDLPQQELWSPGATVRLDLRNSAGHPTRGVMLEGSGSVWRSLDDELPFDWTQYGGRVQAHLPLGSDWHVISLGGGFEAVEPENEDSVIPFGYLPDLGGSSRLRGYPSWRWTDQAVGWATVEYRYRIWEEHTWKATPGALEAAIFADAGDVAPEVGDLDTKDLKTSYGLEVRMFLKDSPLFRLGVAYSDEGTRFNLSTGGYW
ncbi:MAG TPA: BamA/TamA family outer membrane protein [Gemmatimonadota bacterium]|nr:BamA/TamA family outer membrane protein [Gemmatimonadota bacterium]